MLSILFYFVIGFTLFNVIQTLYKNRHDLDFVWKIWKRFQFKMLVEVLITIFFVIVTLTALVTFIPFTSYGWTTLLMDGSSNILVMPVVVASESPNIWFRISGIAFIFLLIFLLPFFAKIEEDLFRRGKTKFAEIFKSSVIFGLVHMIVGVPLAAGLALIIPGFFYAFVYIRKFNSLKNNFIDKHFLGKESVVELLSLGLYSNSVAEWEEEAVLETTAYHTIYNTIVMLLLFSIFFI